MQSPEEETLNIFVNGNQWWNINDLENKCKGLNFN